MAKEIKRLDGDRWEESFIEVYEDDSVKFHERDLSELVWSNPIDTIEHDERRWTRSVETIIKIQDRYFSIFWEKGLTENQPNMFDFQPEEVEKKEKKVVVTTWDPIEEG